MDKLGKERLLKGAYFFIVFFLIFTTAVLLIPTPMFPGDIILSLINAATSPQAAYLSALINGVTYGLIAWAVFAIAMRKIGAPEPEPQNTHKSQPKTESTRTRSRKPRH
jgi:hypothetical protein